MQEKKYTPLFLLELLVSLTLFAVCAAVCLQMFAAARKIGRENQALSGAVLAVQNTAETLKSNRGSLEDTAGELHAERTAQGFFRYFDENWNTVAAGQAVYTLTCTGKEEDGLLYASVSVPDLFAVDVVCRKEEQP